jgi:hypothetical protein
MRAERIEAVVPWTDGGLLRSPGVHVSGLLKAMAIDYGLLNRKWVPEDYDLQDITETGESSSEWWDALDEDSKVRMAIGMAWEQWYLPKLIEKYQPGELECEGIFLTIDGESRDLVLADEDCVHEVKTTSKSINTTGHIAEPNPKNWMWLMQCKAYCKARGVRFIYLHILYLYGDYSRPFKPKLHVWRIEFTQQEIDQAWSLILDRLAHYRTQGRIAPALPLRFGSQHRLQQRALLHRSRLAALRAQTARG